MNDELREQLGKLDPMHAAVPVEPATTQSSRTRLEQIMNSPLIDQDTSGPRADAGRLPSRRAGLAAPRRRWMIVGGAVAAAVLALGVGVMIGNSGGNNGKKAAGPPLELSYGRSIAASCIQFDATRLAGMSPAFAGTVTSVDGGTVTLNVDHWYTGGDAATATLHANSGINTATDGLAFDVGQHYLITATDGQVNFCGYSGLATPELTAAFQTAFGS